jgi:hypothetical protein
MTETKSRQCGQPQPEPTAMTDYITCYCSLPVGHAGEHTSIVNGRAIGIWPASTDTFPRRGDENMSDHQRERWPVDEHGFNALDMQSAADLGECYACIVGVWTGPNSHSPGCDLRGERERR